MTPRTRTDRLPQIRGSNYRPRCCQWPFGHPGEPGFRFCSGPIETAGSSYCDEHRAVAYYKPGENPERGEPLPEGFAFGRKGAA